LVKVKNLKMGIEIAEKERKHPSMLKPDLNPMDIVQMVKRCKIQVDGQKWL